MEQDPTYIFSQNTTSPQISKCAYNVQKDALTGALNKCTTKEEYLVASTDSLHQPPRLEVMNRPQHGKENHTGSHTILL